MPYSARTVRTQLCALLLLAAGVPATAGPGESDFWKLPAAPPKAEYGNVIMNRTSEKNGVKPVAFSHWLHRRAHSCRVCHFELEFNMKANTTEITEAENREGKYCGACHDGKAHDGKILFGHEKEGDCQKCHNGGVPPSPARFAELAALPGARSGNGVDWTKALKQHRIFPVHELTIVPADMNYDKKIKLEAEWWNIPPAVFPHRAHVAWLDCNNCHPDIFNIKKKTTKHFLMSRILAGEFCGVCHGKVSFPLDECRKCHPGFTGE